MFKRKNAWNQRSDFICMYMYKLAKFTTFISHQLLEVHFCL